MLTTSGSSPLTRGTPIGSLRNKRAPRLIPACAGNTPAWSAPARTWLAHPRLRGEHLSPARSAAACAGSSPHARGTPGHVPGAQLHPGLIPAHAGEHRARSCICTIARGSSPLARGTLGTEAEPRCLVRLIPAGAGNTMAAASETTVFPAHPRWRGEHTRAYFAPLGDGGSSPLARGTLDGQPS